MGLELRAKRSHQRPGGYSPTHRSIAWVTTGFLLFVSVGGTVAAQATRGEQSPEIPTDDSEPQTDIHPEAVSEFVTRSYKIGSKKLWTELLSLLEEVGYPPEEVDKDERVVKTQFIDFKSTDYSEEVGEAQPRVTGEYTILQMRRVKQGKVSLEVRISRGERGVDLAIRARILVQGLDRKESLLLLTDRRSSGVIEADFLRILEDRLNLERL